MKGTSESLHNSVFLIHNSSMSDSYIDHIPSQEREKIRKRMRSPEAYEQLRERVKGPDDLEREMERNEKMAEMRFALETEPRAHDMLKKSVENDIREKGAETVLETINMSPDLTKALEQGKFRLAVSSHPVTHVDQLMVLPEGAVQEKLPVKLSFSDTYSAQLAA